MGRIITTDQSHQVMATLATNTDWGEIDFEGSGLQDLIIRNPKEAGRQFTNFLKNGGRVVGARNLVSLKLITDNIMIKTGSFSKDFFSSGSVKLFFGSNFSNWILGVVPDAIPAFQGMLLKTRLTKYMYDSEILDELGHPKSFTISEFAAIVRDLLLKQPNGENGTLLNNGYANIFFVQLEDWRVVAVRVRWDSGGREWDLDAFGGGGWGGGRCVFSRS